MNPERVICRSGEERPKEERSGGSIKASTRQELCAGTGGSRCKASKTDSAKSTRTLPVANSVGPGHASCLIGSTKPRLVKSGTSAAKPVRVMERSRSEDAKCTRSHTNSGESKRALPRREMEAPS